MGEQKFQYNLLYHSWEFKLQEILFSASQQGQVEGQYSNLGNMWDYSF